MLTLSALATGQRSDCFARPADRNWRQLSIARCDGMQRCETARGWARPTRRTLYDYENAIGENTGALLKVHPSNFEIVGFTKTVSTKELVSIASTRGLPVIDDIGSGALIDFSKYGLSDEPIAADSIRDGADVALFSGDKLLGGPQCGIIVGKRKYIQTILQNPSDPGNASRQNDAWPRWQRHCGSIVIRKRRNGNSGFAYALDADREP